MSARPVPWQERFTGSRRQAQHLVLPGGALGEHRTPPTGQTFSAGALDRLTARLLGAGLVIAACDPAGGSRPWADWAFTAVAAGAAWWAGPMVDTRPVQTSLRWYRIAARRRTTVLPVAAVVIAALTSPPVWAAACTVALLLAYLLATDLWTRGVTAPRGSRPLAPALAASAATAVVFLAARLPVAGTPWGRLPAALALAAAAACLGLALIRRRAAR